MRVLSVLPSAFVLFVSTTTQGNAFRYADIYSNHHTDQRQHRRIAGWCIYRGGAGAETERTPDDNYDDDNDDDRDLMDSTSNFVNKIPSGGSDSSSSTSSSSSSSASSSSSKYSSQLEVVKGQVLASAMPSIDDLRRTIVQEATVVPEFGNKADIIVNKALEDFANSAPDAQTSKAATEYETKLLQLETALDAPLQVLYWQQLQLIRDDAIQKYRSASKTSGSSEYEAMLQADAYFVRMAEESQRGGNGNGDDIMDDAWDYTKERNALQTVMNTMAEAGKQATDMQIRSAQQQQTAMQVLQQQQQMIQQLQMQLYGQTSPWNVGVAYRIPDTNFNLQGTYQQGRANVQLSCVPDEYAPFLGPNGFTNGVGPGNLGLSLNLSV